MHVDIAGAGIIGLSIAWRLAQAGCKVTVLDAGQAASQSSWAGAGMLTPAGEFRDDSRWTRLAIQSLAEYGDFVDELTRETGVAIDYRAPGAIELAFTEAEQLILERPRPEGIESKPVAVEDLQRYAPIPAAGVRAAMWFHKEAVVDPRHVCQALLTACKALGVEIRENNELREFKRPTVIAAGAWASRIPGLEGAPRAIPVKGHLLGYRRGKSTLPAIVRHGHHYALQRANGYTIFGSDEQTDVWDSTPEPERVAALATAATALLPDVLGGPPDDFWAGLRPGSGAGEPVVRRLDDRDIWLAYGHYRNGILLAPVTARIIREAILSNLETD